jgi:hypothetical protein
MRGIMYDRLQIVGICVFSFRSDAGSWVVVWRPQRHLFPGVLAGSDLSHLDSGGGVSAGTFLTMDCSGLPKRGQVSRLDSERAVRHCCLRSREFVDAPKRLGIHIPLFWTFA